MLKKLEALGCARRAPMKLRVACGAAPELNAKVCAALRSARAPTMESSKYGFFP